MICAGSSGKDTCQVEYEKKLARLFVCTVTKANQNEALLSKIAVLGIKKTPCWCRKFFLPFLVFYIPQMTNVRGGLNILYFVLSCKVTLV
jgi:hypothetical protein